MSHAGDPPPAGGKRGRPPARPTGGTAPAPTDRAPKPRATDRGREARAVAPGRRPPLRLFTTTLWEYPSQHYDSARAGGVTGSTMQGDKEYVGATPSWVVWQLLQRYTRPGDLVVDPMAGSGTTLDVARDLGRRGLGYDLAPTRPDIFRADARALPLEDASADFVFVDPPYSTHVRYSDDPRCVGLLDAADPGSGYYAAMERVIAEIGRVLRPRRYLALYVSDSWRKRRGEAGAGGGVFMPIGFELFARLRERFTPIDIVAVVRHNQKLARGNWHKAAAEGNFFLRGFNYLLIFKKPGPRGG
ncbi:MAG TPA: DNA methyltransferase [Phycisphaerales bacterium]|nr:DNA methyltransferase [Phycisphaerales bacterium]